MLGAANTIGHQFQLTEGGPAYRLEQRLGLIREKSPMTSFELRCQPSKNSMPRRITSHYESRLSSQWAEMSSTAQCSKAKICFQSSFMLTTVQPLALASSRALSSLPTDDLRS